MGYEITYSYHEEITRGEYNREEIKTKQVKVGSPYEEVPLEIVAGKVMAQLARRNILVVDVEINEYTKKKISFKETSDGILIKNRKFSFDEGAIVSTNSFSETVEENNEQQEQEQAKPQTGVETTLLQLLQNPDILKLLGNKVQSPKQPGALNLMKQKPIRYEIFRPYDKVLLDDAKRRGLAFTIGKRYPVYKERQAEYAQVGMLYTTEDDKGNYQVMSDKFFEPEPKPLTKGFEVEHRNNTDANLDWSSFVDE